MPARNLVDRVLRNVHRIRKNLWQRAHPVRGQRKPVFIVGCHRSGTTMLTHIFRKSYHTSVYNERDPAAFIGARLRPVDQIDDLIERSPGRFIVFKPICDSQWIDRILRVRPNATAIWIYRNYRDAAASMVKKWGGHQKRAMTSLVNGELKPPHWRAERIDSKTLELTKALYSPDMSYHSAALLAWYLRNQIFFDLKLEEREDVIVVKYEDLVKDPSRLFNQVFDYIGCEFNENLITDVHELSIEKGKDISYPDELIDACESMQRDLDRVLEHGRNGK